jgi:hypothetical protein
MTTGGKLPARWVIHTVGPVWQGGSANEAALLASCYRESLLLAAKHDIDSIAFPSISTGIFHYPLVEASKVALSAVRSTITELAGAAPKRVSFVEEQGDSDEGPPVNRGADLVAWSEGIGVAAADDRSGAAEQRRPGHRWRRARRGLRRSSG